ncbi:LPXTG cell wall anchor domain-containing protein [Streptococcus equi]|uniref:Gram-positive cocci surface proteins LPxTG domain-containing protein n=1 Tax=Streptococcus equi subsp. zooepidemicus Sz4is TaxID=1381082 RepID=A0AAW3GIP5_STRSZ|nr:hypothetical protein AT55_02057 [Streptococcus equi subsp. zooepidemicus Sz4is]
MRRCSFLIVAFLFLICSLFNFSVTVNAATTYKLEIQYLDIDDATGQTKLADSKLIDYTPGEQLPIEKLEIPNYTFEEDGWSEATEEAINNHVNLANITLVYQLWYKKSSQIPKPLVEEGTYTAQKTDFSGITFDYENIKDSAGNIVFSGNSDGLKSVSIDGRTLINGVKVWCYDPKAPITDGSKYESEEAGEDIYATMLTILDKDKNQDIITANIQALLWENQGYKDVFNHPYMIENITTLRQYTKEELSIISELREKAKQMKEDYMNGISSKLNLESGKYVSYSDNQVTLNENETITKIVFSATPQAISYYKNGTIKAPEGINVIVDEDSQTITLDISKSLSVGEYEIKFSMLPENKIGKSTKYVSNYGKQTLMDYRMEDPKWEVLKLNVSKPSMEDSKPKTDQDETPKPNSNDNQNPNPKPSVESSTKSTKNTPNESVKPQVSKEQKTTAKPVRNIPKTGDSTNIVISVGLLVISATLLSMLLLLKRRKSSKNNIS